MENFKKSFEKNDIVSGRYHLIGGLFCPFAHRAIIARKLLGLDEHISIDYVYQINTPKGLSFENHKDGVDNLLHQKYLKDIYKLTDENFDQVATVPILIDKTTGKIVSKESADILRLFSTDFRSLHKANADDLYDQNNRQAIDEWDEFVSKYINAGIYRVGFAKSQAEYEEAFHHFFNALDKIENHLATSRYLAGEKLSEVDIKFYTTMVRFDCVYYSLYKANRNHLTDFEHIWNYMRELYQMDAFGSTTDFTIIKEGYYKGTGGLKILKDNGVYPIGDNPKIWEKAHTRK